ncbi:hypothetical protein Cgig2_029804 [Carnegiea gigantea]|uniref:Uncharacterized protein n=1 Tax=Carnegiea gigantea TaxID=171969 RepID=A0A9Q1KLA6_9CARY|nr:hypothetical protein Cgig2_029804 [Carnegiea gigantea]
MNLFSNFASTKQAVEYVRETFRWTLRGSLALRPKSLPTDHHGLCPRFDLRVATRYAHDSNIPKMMQVIFYAIVMDDTAELGLSRMLTMDCMIWTRTLLKAAFETSTIGPGEPRLLDLQTRHGTPHYQEESLLISEGILKSVPKPAPFEFRGPSPEFDHLVAMQFTHAAHIPKMELKWDIVEVWLLFINERLRDTQVPCLVEMVYNPQSHSEVTSRLRDAPPIPSDEE